MAKILIADDDYEIRELIIFTLRFAGHEVIGTSNGEETIERAKQEGPDLILMDVRMPKMNGYEVCKAIKGEKSTEAIPVIFLSVRGQENEVKAGFEVGADDYFLKPISPDRLIEKVNTALARAGKS
jgi:DNA-binding response OmpR family regulator